MYFSKKLIVMSLMSLFWSQACASVSCQPNGTCQCRRFNVENVTFPDYDFLEPTSTTANVMASIECRSRNSPNGQSTIEFEISMNGDTSGREMTKGPNRILFNVYHPNSFNIVLGQNQNAYTHKANLSSNYQVIPITFPAIIPTGQNVIDGRYQGRYRFRVVHPQKNNRKARNQRVRFRVIVNKVCQVSATDINFGTYFATNPSSLTSTGSFKLNCTPNIRARIGVNPGTGSSDFQNRVLSNGSNQLLYNLYIDAGLSTIFGNGQGGSKTIDVITTGGSQTAYYYGEIPNGQFVPQGNYTSTLNVTLDL